MTEPCKGENCPRRDTCERYIDYTYFRTGRSFTASSLCERVGTDHLDYYIPVAQIEIAQ